MGKSTKSREVSQFLKFTKLNFHDFQIAKKSQKLNFRMPIESTKFGAAESRF